MEAVIWGMPAVNYDLMRQEMFRVGGKENQVVYWSRPLDWHNQTLTPNPDSIYLMAFSAVQHQTRNKEANMKKLKLALIAVTGLLGGLLLSKSDATALAGLVGAPAVTKKYPSIQKAGCFLAGRYCRVGFHWVCGLPPNPERRRCHCVPC